MKSYSFSHNDLAMQNDINFFETSVGLSITWSIVLGTGESRQGNVISGNNQTSLDRVLTLSLSHLSQTVSAILSE